MEFYSKDEKKIEICRVLLKDNTWSKYRLDRFSNEGAITFETKKQFDSLDELCSFYNIHKVRELGVNIDIMIMLNKNMVLKNLKVF